jgi:four helix bundle protein
MSDFAEDMKMRTKAIGVAIIKLMNDLPAGTVSFRVIDQIISSSTSIGANYRAACRAKSIADFINKLKIVEEETDETMYWIEVFNESEIIPEEMTQKIYNELGEILSIVVSSINTAKSRSNRYNK